MDKPLRLGLVVGEGSGDILGASLMRAIRKIAPQAEFIGVGGPLMIQEGFVSLHDQERLAVMGLIEPLKRLPELLTIRRQLKDYFLTNPPDLFLGIDSPDFNLSLELSLREAGIKTAHYVSPSVWAWRQGRVKKIAQAVDLILTLFPFEAAFYQQHSVPVKFVGHPLADQIKPVTDCQPYRDTLGIQASGPVIALMPGSREAEVRLIGPLLWQAARLCLQVIPQARFVVPSANPRRHQQLEQQLQEHADLPIQLIAGQSQAVMSASDMVVMASGTTTLEALLLGKPMVVTYKMAWLSYAILARLVRSPYISLPNLLANKALVPELIQDQATPEAIAENMVSLVSNIEVKDALVQQFNEIHRSLAQGASEQAAGALMELISQ